MNKLFMHPQQVCMTYLEHFWFSMEMSYTFGIASIQAIVHAFYPDACVHSTTDTIHTVQTRLKQVGCR